MNPRNPLSRCLAVSSFVLTLILSSPAVTGQSSVTVTRSLPVNTTSATSPVAFAFSASSNLNLSITGWELYIDGISQYQGGATSSIQPSLPVAPGVHSVVARAWNSSGAYSSANFNLTVVPSSGIAVTQTLPSNMSSATSPVPFSFSASSGYPITGWELYVDGLSKYQSLATTSIQTNLNIVPGTHSIVARAWDSSGAYASSNFSLTVVSFQGVTVAKTLPTNTSAVSPVTFAFSASSGLLITGWELYVDNVPQYHAGAVGNIQTSLPLAAGTHSIVARAWDASGAYASSDFSLAVTAPSGVNYYVSPSGSDSNNGSAGSPWATLQHAANNVVPGATVHVAAGTYAPVATNVNGTASARIRFLSDVKWAAAIAISGTDTGWRNNANYVDIEGFDISGSAGRLGIANNASFVRIIGNRVHNLSGGSCNSNGGAAIDNENYFASDDDVIGNVVHDIGPTPGTCNTIQGIYHSNLRGHVYNNIVYRVSAWGIQLWHAANNVTISSNLVFNNGGPGVGGGIIIGDGDSPGGVTNDNTVVTNNIVMNNGGAGIEEFGSVGTHNVYANNLMYQNSSAFDLLYGTPVGTLSVNPQLVNYQPDGSGDYHLSSSSPAINAGATQGAPANDCDGGPRPVGTGFDIGPYEFGTTVPAWPYE